ncbi:DUF2062 domain-containing protein [Haloparvum sp. AD34]
MLPELRARIRRDVDRTRGVLHQAFTRDHSSKEVAGSFALGVFITMLPTLGVGFLAFVALAFVFKRLSKLALFASVIVFNPVVKWGVYGASYGLGVFLLGPVEGISVSEVSLTAAPAVVYRLVLGNTILAIVAAVPSYFVALRTIERYRESDVSVLV